jgi:hypothetical protein
VSQPGDLIGNPNARGLPKPETRVNFQDITGYLEWAPTERFSFFVEAPVRFLEPEVNDNATGLSDMNVGFKWAFLYQPERILTFQLRTYLPTGEATEGLGTGHVTVEPSLLYHRRVTERFTVESQFGVWVPIGGTDFAGDVLQYGIGGSYLIYDTPKVHVWPVIELMGWTVLSGKETASLGNNIFEIRNAAGDSILNAKFGLRVGIGERNDFYAGYGQALTGDVWYHDIVRLEWRHRF